MVNGQAAKRGVSVLTRDGATASTNLTVLRRSDPLVEEVLGTAGHVCLYSFDVDKKEWVRPCAPSGRFVPCSHGSHGLCRAARMWRDPCLSSAGEHPSSGWQKEGRL